jgi:hypothetical protein
MWNLYDNVAARLKHEGHTVEEVKTGEQNPEWLKELKERRELIDLQHCVDVANAPLLDQNAIQQIKAKERATPEERLAVEKAAISTFAVTDEVTPKLVEEFPDLVGGVSKLEDLQHGLAVERDQRAIEKQAKWGFGLYIPDMPVREQQRVLREKLGLLGLIDRLLQKEQFTNESLKDLETMVKTYHKQVNGVLKLGVSAKCSSWSGVRIFNALMKQLAIPTITERVGKKNISTTQLDSGKWELVTAILKRREDRRQQQLLEQSQTAVDEVMIKGDTGAYINKQSPVSPNSIVEKSPTVASEVLPELNPHKLERSVAVGVDYAEVQGFVRKLMTCDHWKVAKDIMQGMRDEVAQRVWSKLPNWRQQELLELSKPLLGSSQQAIA